MNPPDFPMPDQRRCSSRRRFALRLAVVLAGFGLSGVCPPAFATGYSVQQVQAVLLFNFAQFVKWPPDAFPDDNTPVTIGVLGTNPFNGALENAIRGENIGGRRMAVRFASRAEDLKKCQIVFICQSESLRVSSLLAAFRDTPVLTVSDIPRFCDQGGMINLVLEGGRVKFVINPRPAKTAGLQISSKLLRLAY